MLVEDNLNDITQGIRVQKATDMKDIAYLALDLVVTIYHIILGMFAAVPFQIGSAYTAVFLLFCKICQSDCGMWDITLLNPHFLSV